MAFGALCMKDELRGLLTTRMCAHMQPKALTRRTGVRQLANQLA